MKESLNSKPMPNRIFIFHQDCLPSPCIMAVGEIVPEPQFDLFQVMSPSDVENDIIGCLAPKNSQFKRSVVLFNSRFYASHIFGFGVWSLFNETQLISYPPNSGKWRVDYSMLSKCPPPVYMVCLLALTQYADYTKHVIFL